MHVVIEPLSQIWWGGVFSSFTIILLLFLFKKILKAYQLLFMKILSLMLFISWLDAHYNSLFINENWSLQNNLPLHLC